MSRMFTYGGQIDLANPRAADIAIEDIAHHLACEPRFNGATTRPMWVAHHSILVSLHVPDEHALAGLLHDGPEAYCKDLHRPLKELVARVYSPIEQRLWDAIAVQFDLERQLPEAVKRADQLVLAAEIRDLIRPSDLRDEALAMLPDPTNVRTIEPLDWWEAELAFLARFHELRGQHHSHHWNVLG